MSTEHSSSATEAESSPVPGLCYVVPRYDPAQFEHFAHLPALLNRVGALAPLAVIIEKGTAPPGLEKAREVIVLRHGDSSRLRRAFELHRTLRRCARDGYRNVFIRYSRLAATVVILFRRSLGMHLWYWASGQADMIVKSSLAQRLKRTLDGWHIKWIIRHAYRFVTGPESMITHMTNRWSIDPRKVLLLYNDIDTARYHPESFENRIMLRRQQGWPDSEFVVLFVHRIAARRGSGLLVPIAEGLSTRLGRPFRLVVVGDGPEMLRLLRDVEESVSRDRIQVVGPVPNLVLHRWYQAADCFLMPSYEEGFPRVILEAMASGLPIVSTRAGGTVDIVEPSYPFLADPGDVDTLVEHLVAVGSDETLRADLGGRLRQRSVSRFDTQAVARMLVQHLSDERNAG